MANRETILACRPCRLEGRRFTTPYTPAGERKMDRHFDTHHPQRSTR